MNSGDDWLSIDAMLEHRWQQAEARRDQLTDDHHRTHLRAWLRRILWNLRGRKETPHGNR